MAKGKLELNRSGVNELLHSEGLKAAIEEEAGKIAGRAGKGFSFRTHATEQRNITNVYPETKEAINDTLKNNALLKAVGK